jgi:hypothetical protein
MDTVSKSTALKCLENDWSKFVTRFASLAPEDREKYLQRQGFSSYSGLLAHIGAWWKEAIANIQAVMENPDVSLRTYDVDRFNLEAVQAVSGKTEKEVVREFEEIRRKLLRAVSNVDESMVPNLEMQNQFYWMITNHYTEHQG